MADKILAHVVRSFKKNAPGDNAGFSQEDYDLGFEQGKLVPYNAALHARTTKPAVAGPKTGAARAALAAAADAQAAAASSEPATTPENTPAREELLKLTWRKLQGAAADVADSTGGKPAGRGKDALLDFLEANFSAYQALGG